MKAVFFKTHGGPEVLEYGEIPMPEPGPGEVLLRLKAAALNGLDLWVRRGWPGIRLEYPHVPGADGAGEVAALGAGVKGWSVGDRAVINANLSCGECDACLAGQDNRCRNWGILGETRWGTYAQYLAVPARNLLPLPPDFPEQDAAAAALAFQTAWHSLITRGRLRAGESVLVVGASGGVNTACIQLARLAGATVLVVGSGPEKLALAESLGAQHLIDRSATPDWSQAIYSMTGRRGVDVVVDNVGTTLPLSFRAAAKGGRILTVGNTAGYKVEIDNRYIFARHLSLIGSTMSTRSEFNTVMSLIFERRLRPVIDRVFSLSEARAAQERMESGQQMGKIVLEMG